MAKGKKEYSAEELNTIQEKYLAGDKLSKYELIAIGIYTSDDEGEEQNSTDIDKLAEAITSILDKRNGSVVGGKPHIPLSAEEVAKLPKKTMEEAADEYFQGKDSTNFPWPGIHVTSDLQVFIGNVQGENALSNHMSANTSLTKTSFQTPGREAVTE